MNHWWLSQAVIALLLFQHSVLAQLAVTDEDFVEDQKLVGTWEGRLEPYFPDDAPYTFIYVLNLTFVPDGYMRGLRGTLKLKQTNKPNYQGPTSVDCAAHMRQGFLGLGPVPSPAMEACARNPSSCMTSNGMLKPEVMGQMMRGPFGKFTLEADGALSGVMGFSTKPEGTIRFVRSVAVSKKCDLKKLSGDFKLQKNALGRDPIVMFQSPMAEILSKAIKDLNARGIVPTITSGFRTSADQQRMRSGGSGANPAAKGASQHQLGLAIDISTMDPNFQAIKETFVNAGLTWGGTFTKKDPVHFQLAKPGTIGNLAIAKACEEGS